MSRFDFREPKNLAVFACNRVIKQGAPVLYVCRDQEGDWQFLCGGTHEDDSEDAGMLVCLDEVVSRDPTLNELAHLCAFSRAERDALGDAWREHDEMEDIVRSNVEQHGCHVMMIPEDEEGPGFAYSIGLMKSFAQAELICFGLDSELMHSLINSMRDRMAAGEQFAAGMRVAELIEGYECELRQMRREHYPEYMGYACIFNGDAAFDVLQVVWPDKSGHFPWQPEYGAPRGLQPETWK
jgi:hypothetical protein